MAMVAGRKPPASTPYLAQRRDGALSPTIGCSTRHWLDPESFNDWGGRGYDDSVPGVVIETAPSGDRTA